MAEVGLILLEAVVGIALERVVNAADKAALLDEVRTLSASVVGVQEQVAALHDTVQRLAGNEPPEVRRFRTVRFNAHSSLACFDPSLADFAAELVASLLEAHALGFQLVVRATKVALDRGCAFESSDFDVVVAASKSVRQNIALLERFFNHVTRFVDFQPMSKLEKPSITLNIVGGRSTDFRAFEIMRYRIAMRLASLDALAFNWNVSALGTLRLGNVLFSNHDVSLLKFVNNTGMDCGPQISKFRLIASDQFLSLAALLRNSIESCMTCIKVIFLSFDEWITADKAQYHGFSEKIRTFLSGPNMRCVEVKLSGYSAWDHINLEQILFWGLSSTIVVFRFATVEQLGVMLEASKQITMKYPRLTDDVERILYVESSSTDGVRQLREDITRTAIKKRMPEPRGETDILFEKSYSSKEEMMEYIRKRGGNKQSIFNTDMTGKPRALMTTIMRIFNREITCDEAEKDSRAVAGFASKIKGASASSALFLKKDDGEIVLTSGDQNKGFLLQRATHFFDDEYEDFRSIPRKCSANLNLAIRLSGMDSLFAYSFWRKWRVVHEVMTRAENKTLYLSVVWEQKKTMANCFPGSQRPIVSNVSVYAMGGENLTDYFHARLMSCVWNIINLPEDETKWTSLRVLFELIPGLSDFCRQLDVRQLTPTESNHSARAFIRGKMKQLRLRHGRHFSVYSFDDGDDERAWEGSHRREGHV